MTETAADQATRFVRRPDIFFTVVDGELIIMDGAEEKFLSSNAVAVAIWERLESAASVDELCDVVLAQFGGASREVVRRDVAEFADALESRGLVTTA